MPSTPAPAGIVLRTERLVLRRLTEEHAPFVLALVSDPDWRRFIGDPGVRTLAAAREWARTRVIAGYERDGFGLWLVELARSGEPVGICGPLRRPELADVDLGFALLPEHRGRGYVHEAASGVLAHVERVLGLRRVAAIVRPDNAASIRVLERLGFRYERSVPAPSGGEELEHWLRLAPEAGALSPGGAGAPTGR